MNLSLLDPFNHKFPEVVTQKLGEGGQYLFSQFSPSGHYVLCGGNNGCCYILDTTTYGVVRVLDHPGGTVTCMSMTKDNRFVITGSDANTIKIWDVLDLKELFSYQCPSSVTSVCVNLLNGKQYAVAFSKDSPIFINFEKGFDNPPIIEQILVSDRDAKSKSLLKNSGSYTSIAIDPTSSYVLCGTLKGNLFLYQISNPQVVLTKKVASSPITQIVFHPNSREFLLNCRVSIHLFNFQLSPLSIKELNRFTDQIDKLNWSQCGFDHTGDYVVGGISSLAEHILHVWLKSSGILEKFLEGPKEGLRHFTWHPTLPNVISTTAVGNTYFWEPTYPQLWSAFAPKFIELEENVEYVEKEDEFDITIPDENQKNLVNSKAIEGEDDVIDIESVNHLLYNIHGQDVEEVLLDVQLESDLNCPQPLKVSKGPKVRKGSVAASQDDKKSLDSPKITESSIPQTQSSQQLDKLTLGQLETTQSKLDKEPIKYISQASSPPRVNQGSSPQYKQAQNESLKRKSSPTVSSPVQNRFSSSNSSHPNEAPKTPTQKHKSSLIESSPKQVKPEILKTPERNRPPQVSSSSRKQSTPERFKPSSQLRSSPLKPSPPKLRANTIHVSQPKSSPNTSPKVSEVESRQKSEESDEEGELHSNDEVSPPSSQSRGYGPPQHHSSRSRPHSNLQHTIPHPQQHHGIHYSMRPPNSQPYWYGHGGHPGYTPHQPHQSHQPHQHQHQPLHLPGNRSREAISLFGGFYPQKGPTSRSSSHPKHRASPSAHDGDRRNAKGKAEDSEVEEGEISE